MSDHPSHGVVFFRHLPKTAGTSLTTTLANIYGDAQTHRFREVADGFATMFSGVLQARGDALSLVSGHIPLLAVPEGACGPEFTILREPIARLLSLRRFLEQQPPDDRARMGLGERITIADMLASRKPEVFGQVRNGMARFFTSHHSFANPSADEFWNLPGEGPVINDCLATLNRMTVGTVEDMPTALLNLQRRLQIPYALEIGMENFTVEKRDEVSIEDIRALIEVNAIDLALFHTVMKRLPRARPTMASGGAIDRRTLFNPQPDTQYNPLHIPGRQGFELYEPRGKLCWLGDSGRGRIHLAPSAVPLALAIALYFIVPHYSREEVRFRIDGQRWPTEIRHDETAAHFILAPIPAHAGPIELSIEQPYAVPASVITAGSPDRRRLGTALINLRCDAA